MNTFNTLIALTFILMAVTSCGKKNNPESPVPNATYPAIYPKSSS